MEKHIGYKLTTQDLTAYGGFKWQVGKQEVIETAEWEMCSPHVFHYYENARLAVFMNSIHANIENPRLFECEIEGIFVTDGTKNGAKRLSLIREIDIWKPTTEQLVEGAIRIAMLFPQNEGWMKWAEKWLSDRNRNRNAEEEEAAWAAAAWAAWAAAAWAARAAEAEARAAAAEAARAAAWAAARAAAAGNKDVVLKMLKIIDSL